MAQQQPDAPGVAQHHRPDPQQGQPDAVRARPSQHLPPAPGDAAPPPGDKPTPTATAGTGWTRNGGSPLGGYVPPSRSPAAHGPRCAPCTLPNRRCFLPVTPYPATARSISPRARSALTRSDRIPPACRAPSIPLGRWWLTSRWRPQNT